MARTPVPALGISAAVGWLVLGCGGGAPLLHEAHALSPGVTANGVGFSGTFTTGAARDAVNAERDALAPSSSGFGTQAKAFAVHAAMAPAVAPWLSARVGLAGDNEVGLSFTGRALRFDARHAFEDGPVAVSLGAAGSMSWRSADPLGSSEAVFHNGSGYGFDVPVLVGWRSDAGVVSIWGGARGGIETIGVWLSPQADPSMRVAGLNLLRRYIGGVAGLAMGMRHVHVALELDVLYHAVSGDIGDFDVKVNGITLTPAGALIFTF